MSDLTSLYVPWRQSMIRMFYISKAAPGLTSHDYEEILAASRRNNGPAGVTGLLVVKDGYFAQALEGEEAAVTGIFEKIEKDPRHSGVVTLAMEETDDRIFPGWQMGYRDLNSRDVSKQISQVNLGDERFVTSPAELSIVFRSFVENAPAG